MNYTSIEQSAKLLQLGLNSKTADMCYPKDAFAVNYDEEPVCHYSGFGLAHPCWSLGALLEVMPKIQEDDEDGGCCPDLCKGWDNCQWHCVYRSSIHITKWYDNPLDAAFEMVCWLLENGYIKNE